MKSLSLKGISNKHELYLYLILIRSRRLHTNQAGEDLHLVTNTVHTTHKTPSLLFFRAYSPIAIIATDIATTLSHLTIALLITFRKAFRTLLPSLAWGNGSSGTGQSRILQRGSQPSLTSKKYNRSARTTRFSWKSFLSSE